MNMEQSSAPLLDIEGLDLQFRTAAGTHTAVRDLSFTLRAGETLGLVGESGSGKSVTALSLMRLIPDPPGQVTAGRALFDGRDLLALPPDDIRRLRGNEISMVFQEPMTSLNPLHTCGRQVMEPLLLHKGLGKKAARARALELLNRVGIPAPEQRLGEYPHQLSGGMRQRVMIAMALACGPRLLIADEPTTALDATIQAQILELMKTLRRETGAAIILITHDLGVVAEMCSHVVVMYAGQVVEDAPAANLFARPLHPYTEGLLRSIPAISAERERLFSIDGTVPDPFAMPLGCAFAPRCCHARPMCREEEPVLSAGPDNRRVRCFFWRENALSSDAESKRESFYDGAK
ncbi:MAG: ABC transporter ATP-binding protein [Gracilibacteraceae bacterium]|jgi:oligopeptide/dipeptide ABC transporter ATP-binding protein|nr:ABC transporter ATP-binding protein [Gracilibacteraceae bacterium]